MLIKFSDKELELYEMVNDNERETWQTLNEYGYSKLYLESVDYSVEVEKDIKEIISVRNLNLEQINTFANMNDMSVEEAYEIAYEGYDDGAENAEEEKRIVPINLAKATLIANSGFLKEARKGVTVNETNYRDLPNKSGYELIGTGEEWDEILHALMTVVARHYDSEPQEFQLMLWVKPDDEQGDEMTVTAKINDEESIAALSLAAISFALHSGYRDEFFKHVEACNAEEGNDND